MRTTNRFRTNFHLSSKLLGILNNKSEGKGVTRSSLINKWISLTKKLALNVSVGGNVDSIIHINLNDSSRRTLSKLSKLYGLSNNTVLRLILREQLVNETIENIPINDDIELLWKKGNLNEIVRLYGDKVDWLDRNSLFYLIKTYIRYQEFALVKKLLNSARLKTRAHKIIKSMLLVEANVAERNLGNAKNILESIKLGDITDREQRGEYYFYKAYICGLEMDIAKADYYFTKAFEVFDSNNHPQRMIDTYIYLSYISMRFLKFDEVNVFLDNAEEIAELAQNDLFLGWVYHCRARLCLLERKPRNARLEIEKAMKLVKDKEIEWYFMYLYRAEGEVSIQLQEFAKAEKFFRKSNKFSKKHSTAHTSADLFLNYIFAHKGEQSSIVRIDDKELFPEDVVLKDYLRYSARYLFSTNKSDVAQAKKGLLDLAGNIPIPQLHNAVNNIVKNKRFASLAL